MIRIKIKRVESGLETVADNEIPLPSYQTTGSVGMDLYAAHDLDVMPVPRLVGTGIAIEIPDGYEAQVRPRSSLSMRGCFLANPIGTIDQDYRGEIKVGFWSYIGHTLILRGDRIAQLVISPVVRAELVEVDELSDTDRGSGGFGSTGK